MMFSTPPAAFPNSAEYELVNTWNSRTASWLKVTRELLTLASAWSRPSTLTLFDRERWPANTSSAAAAVPWLGPRSTFTPGVRRAKDVRSLALLGRPSICCCDTTVAIAVLRVSTIDDSAATTVNCSVMDGTSNVIDTSTPDPTVSTTSSSSSAANPNNSARTA